MKVASLSWGNTIVDFLDPLGLTLQDFAQVCCQTNANQFRQWQDG